MSKVSREFSFGWATVKPPGETVTFDTDLRFFRRDMETGREIDNDEIHGVKNAITNYRINNAGSVENIG